MEAALGSIASDNKHIIIGKLIYNMPPAAIPGKENPEPEVDHFASLGVALVPDLLFSISCF